MLRPQDELAAEAGDVPPDSVQPDLANLLGAIGVAATPLRPAGKTQFGDEFVDVVAEGGYVLPGTRVQVIEIEGNRVVVKEV
jgi:membrane-bound serine protease (ClpP class)